MKSWPLVPKMVSAIKHVRYREVSLYTHLRFLFDVIIYLLNYNLDTICIFFSEFRPDKTLWSFKYASYCSETRKLTITPGPLDEVSLYFIFIWIVYLYIFI